MTNFEHLIETALRKFPKAKRIAVENFTFSADKMDMATTMNLEMDAGLYKWNAHTVNAIRWVINNKVDETFAGAIKCGNRSFILPPQQITSIPD
jgi:hypothetical protein